MPKKLLPPEYASRLLARRFENQSGAWLEGGGTWPLRVALGLPTEAEAVANIAGVRAWAHAWSGWNESGRVLWEERHWDRLGIQRLPATLELSSPADVASAIGASKRWSRAAERYRIMRESWPAFSQSGVLAKKFDMLADYFGEDFERLLALLRWLETNPTSGLYLRQLPVPGLDTKWTESRTGAITDLVRTLRSGPPESDFFALCGLKVPPYRLRIRVLCPRLRKAFGGLCDIEGPLKEFAALEMNPQAALIVENLATGLALPDLPGTIAIMKLGNAVDVLASVPWLRSAAIHYWGDIDTHGFAILSRARSVLPGLKSLLMDSETLLAHRPLWVHETEQHPDAAPEHLLPSERSVFDGLRSNAWGERVRLEQERLPWDFAVATVAAEMKSAAHRND